MYQVAFGAVLIIGLSELIKSCVMKISDTKISHHFHVSDTNITSSVFSENKNSSIETMLFAKLILSEDS